MRSLAINPLTWSAGQVAHQPATRTRRPASDQISQSALTLRAPPFTGAWPPPGASTMKSRTPCSSGGRPVAIVVQMIGDSSGGSARRTPSDATCFSLAKVGKRPAATRRIDHAPVGGVDAEERDLRRRARRRGSGATASATVPTASSSPPPPAEMPAGLQTKHSAASVQARRRTRPRGSMQSGYHGRSTRWASCVDRRASCVDR